MDRSNTITKQITAGIKKRKTNGKSKTKNLIKLGSWNVKTMLKAGKMKEIFREMQKYDITILALQEIRWEGTGIIEKSSYTLYYAGEKKQGKNGTAFIINNSIKEKIKKFKAINGRISYIQVENKQANFSIINVYAPTEKAEEQEKTEFYEKLEETCENIPKNDILILIGDFNAQIGIEEQNKNVAGRETIHNKTNDNGEKLCNLAAITNTFIMSTKFKHKRHHKITWMIPGSTEGNQIDHVMISRKWEKIVHDVRTYRGANVDSDHFLIIAKVKMKIIRNSKQPTIIKRWNLEKLKGLETKQEYSQKVKERLQPFQQNRIEENWEDIKKSILLTTEETLGKKPIHKQNEWFDDDCKQRIYEKNEARNNWIRSGKECDLNDYREKRKIATKYCKEKKEKWINEYMKQIEDSNKDNKKLYEMIKTRNKKKTIQSQIRKEEWEQYFTQIYKADNEELDNERQIIMDNDIDEETPTYDEFMEQIKKTKNNRTPGPDNINYELIKNGGEELLRKMYDLIVEIWKQETMPSEWSCGLLYPMHKKGSLNECNNYRGIMLLNTSYKIFTSILRQRLVNYIDRKMGDYQQGFRAGKSTIDAIHIMTQTIEKCYEHDIELYIIFIDFKIAFDSINRQTLIEDMIKIGTPSKLVKLTKMTMDNSCAKIMTSEGTTDNIIIQKGVRQGDALSTTLFNIALDGAIKETNIKNTLIGSSTQIIAYADDIVLLARDKNRLEEAFIHLKEKTTERGLKINMEKTKYMTSSRRRKTETEIEIGGDKLKKVDDFKYLGVIINGENNRSVEIKERILAGNRAYWGYQKFLRDKNITRKTKLRIYKTAIRPVVTYAAETICLTKQDENKLRIFERKILRKIFGLKKIDNEYRSLWNKEIDNIMEGEDVVRQMKAKRLRWFGHIERRENDAIIKKIKDWKPNEERPRGRPKIRWADQVKEDLQKLGVRNIKELTANRKKWNEVVNRAKQHKEL